MAVKVQLSQGKFALVDEIDRDVVSQHTWYADGDGHTFYARNKQFRMHRLIMGVTDPAVKVDHRNGNGLDNRRKNLRLVQAAGNSQNQRGSRNGTSQYKGVSWVKGRDRWRSRIQVGDDQIHLGYFKTQVEAADAYDQAARQHFQYPACNFPQLGERSAV